VVVSAHWESAPLALSATDAATPLVYDFGGFDERYYRWQYQTPDAARLAHNITSAFSDVTNVHQHPSRGLDHGAWVPLLLAYPDADIPVLQLSVQSHLGPAHHVALGAALAKLRAEEVLVIGSGSFTHDLRRFRGQAMDAPATTDVIEFSDWMDAALTKGRRADLLTYRTKAPHAAMEHPTEEHLLPLYVAMGAAGPAAKATRLHQSAMYSILRMDAYAFA